MHLDGTIADNLSTAFASARRLRRHPVYEDTLAFWQDLLREARQVCSRLTPAQVIDALIEQLDLEPADRPR